MSDIYDVMAEETRQSYFQLESLTTSLDSKVFGVITADALLFSVFTYIINESFSNKLFYIAPALISVSFILLLVSVWPRRHLMHNSKDVIKKYGKLDPREALSQLAANYADLEKELSKTYDKKYRWFFAGLVLTILSMAIELMVFGYIILDP